MKLTAVFLICFMLGSFGTTCSDGCEDEAVAHDYKLVLHDAHEHHAEVCSPFCGCSSCQTLTVIPTLLKDQHKLPSLATSGREYLNEPESPGSAIWQPPRL